MSITYSEFIKKHVGKAMDFDGVAGSQCVDLIKYYLKEVFNINPGAWGDAHCYYDNYNNLPLLKQHFTRIANTPDFVPRKGDIVVWSPALSSGGWGHVAIATGEGNTTYFYSYDQNWTGNHDACKMVKHNYNCVYGVLRPKDQTKITGVKKAKKSVSELAKEVIAGKWGNGETRKKKLTAAGYNYNAVQTEVNKIANQKKTVTYTVKKGDTLASIAKKHKTTVAKIAKDNNIENVNLIYSGQKIKIK